jgi:hypothetical protein
MSMVVVHAFAAFAVKALRQVKTALARFHERMVERQMRKARFESEMYGGMYRHSSKNDDDLPVVR